MKIKKKMKKLGCQMDSFSFGLNARFLLGTTVGGKQSVQKVENSSGNILMDGAGRNTVEFSGSVALFCTYKH